MSLNRRHLFGLLTGTAVAAILPAAEAAPVFLPMVSRGKGKWYFEIVQGGDAHHATWPEHFEWADPSPVAINNALAIWDRFKYTPPEGFEPWL